MHNLAADRCVSGLTLHFPAFSGEEIGSSKNAQRIRNMAELVPSEKWIQGLVPGFSEAQHLGHRGY